MTPGRWAASANGSILMSRSIIQSGKAAIGHFLLKGVRRPRIEPIPPARCNPDLAAEIGIDFPPAPAHERGRSRGKLPEGERIMVAWLMGLLAALPASADNTVETLFVKVGPMPLPAGRSAGRDKAVVLVHGLGLHPFSSDKALRAKLRPWQQADSPLVKTLA